MDEKIKKYFNGEIIPEELYESFESDGFKESLHSLNTSLEKNKLDMQIRRSSSVKKMKYAKPIILNIPKSSNEILGSIHAKKLEFYESTNFKNKKSLTPNIANNSNKTKSEAKKTDPVQQKNEISDTQIIHKIQELIDKSQYQIEKNNNQCYSERKLPNKAQNINDLTKEKELSESKGQRNMSEFNDSKKYVRFYKARYHNNIITCCEDNLSKNERIESQDKINKDKITTAYDQNNILNYTKQNGTIGIKDINNYINHNNNYNSTNNSFNVINNNNVIQKTKSNIVAKESLPKQKLIINKNYSFNGNGPVKKSLMMDDTIYHLTDGNQMPTYKNNDIRAKINSQKYRNDIKFYYLNKNKMDQLYITSQNNYLTNQGIGGTKKNNYIYDSKNSKVYKGITDYISNYQINKKELNSKQSHKKHNYSDLEQSKENLDANLKKDFLYQNNTNNVNNNINCKNFKQISNNYINKYGNNVSMGRRNNTTSRLISSYNNSNQSKSFDFNI